jgi:hypothetical protein
MSVGASKSPAQSRSEPVRMIEVGPCPADHLPVKLTQNVLTQLLLIDHVAAVLGGIQFPTVLDLAVELPDRPTLLPGEIDPGGESTVVIEDLKLQLGRCDARLEKPARLRDSPALSLRPSMKAATRRARITPGQRRIRSMQPQSSARSSPARNAESPTTTAASNGKARARSAIVRALLVVGTPSTSTISEGTRGAAWRSRRRRLFPPGTSGRVS